MPAPGDVAAPTKSNKKAKGKAAAAKKKSAKKR